MSRRLYLAPLPEFVNDVLDQGFADRLSKRLEQIGSREASSGEIGAWRRSLAELAGVLRRPEFDGASAPDPTMR